MKSLPRRDHRLRVILACLALAFLPLLSSRAADRPLAKFEPPDGVTYHGLCLTGFWSPDEFSRSLAHYRTAVTDRPLVLHSWFAHCQEHGKWRT